MKKTSLIFIVTIFLVLFCGTSIVSAGAGIPYRVDIDDESLLEDDPDFLENPPSWQLKSYSVYPFLQRQISNKSIKVIKFKAVFEYTGETLSADINEKPVMGTAMCKIQNPYYFYEKEIKYKGSLPLESGKQVATTVLIPFSAQIAAQLRKNPITCNVNVKNANDFPVQYIFEVKRVGREFKMTFVGTNTNSAPELDENDSSKTEKPTGLPAIKTPPAVTPQDHILEIKGFGNATLTIIEYADPECPYCQTFHTTLGQIVARYGGEVRWVYRHFLLTSMHPGAQKKAEASECAGELGGETAFWAFIDILMDSKPKVSELSNIAVSLKIDKDAFNQCLSSHKYKNTIEEQMAGAMEADVAGTPHTTILGPSGLITRTMGAKSYEEMVELIENALKAK